MEFELGNMSIRNTTASLQNNVNNLAKIRSRAPHQVWPILDLRLAKDDAMLTRLEQKPDGSTVAAGHQQLAKALLLSLGGQDVSDGALNNLADRQLRSRLKP